MPENKTKVINLDNHEKDKFLSQFKKNKRKKSDAVDTGNVHDVSAKAKDSEDNGLVSLWGDEYKKKYKNPIKRLYKMVNEEELSDSASETLVRVFGIVIGLVIIIAVIVLCGLYYFTYSSYSANYHRAESAENVGNYEQALRYYEKALDATDNKEKRIEVLNDLIRLSEDQETNLNVKSYLLELIQEDPKNSDNILKLKQLYLESEDIDAIFNLASEIGDYETSELLFDIIKNQPVFNYRSGTYDEPLTITITSDDDCKIYYTTDGSEATESGKLFSEPIQVANPGKTVIHAISINSDGVKSKDYSVTYDIISDTLESPSVFPVSGTYVEETEIVIETPSGYEAYYTLDGSEPDINSAVYHKGMTIPYGNHIFTVKFISASGNESQSVSRIYIFEPDYDIALNEAIYLLKKELINSGILYDADGVVYNQMNTTCEFNCSNIISLNDELFYSISMTDTYGGDSKYAVHVNNGAVFKLNNDQSGNYYLTAVK